MEPLPREDPQISTGASRKLLRLFCLLILLTVAFLVIPSGLALAQQSPTYGFDAHQPFIDHDATALLAKPGMKIVTAYVAVGNRLDTVLPFTLTDIALRDENDTVLPSTIVAPIWKPPLPDQAVAPQTIVGGYISWEVPFYTWPMEIDYTAQGREPGTIYGWEPPVFRDVNAGYRYYKQIGELFYRGMLSGSASTDFRPGDPILRGQLAKLLVLAASPYNTASFSYPAGFLAEATHLGLLAASSNNGTAPVTRLDLALGVAQLAKGSLKAPPASYHLPFRDVPASAVAALSLLTYNGIASGTSATTFSPGAIATRGQAAKMIALVLNPSVPYQER